MSMIDKILSRLRPVDKQIKIKIQIEEGDWTGIGFFINYEQRIALIDSIENKAEIPAEFLEAFAEQIRLGNLNRNSRIAEERQYYDRMFKLMTSK